MDRGRVGVRKESTAGGGGGGGDEERFVRSPRDVFLVTRTTGSAPRTTRPIPAESPANHRLLLPPSSTAPATPFSFRARRDSRFIRPFCSSTALTFPPPVEVTEPALTRPPARSEL